MPPLPTPLQAMAPTPSSSRQVTSARLPTTARTPGAITRRPQPRHGLDVSHATLFVDTEVVPLATVKGYTAVGLSEKDLSSAFATIGIFSLVSAVMIFGVVEIGWRTNLLLEGALFGAIAICATAELFGARRQTLYTFQIELQDGRRVAFVTADPTEAASVKAALDRSVAGQA